MALGIVEFDYIRNLVRDVNAALVAKEPGA